MARGQESSGYSSKKKYKINREGLENLTNGFRPIWNCFGVRNGIFWGSLAKRHCNEDNDNEDNDNEDNGNEDNNNKDNNNEDYNNNHDPDE